MQLGQWGLIRRMWGLSGRAKLKLVGGLLWDRRVPPSAKLVVLGTIVYLVVPFDVVPDFIPLAGQVDDIIAIATATILVLRLTPEQVIAEHIAALERRYTRQVSCRQSSPAS